MTTPEREKWRLKMAKQTSVFNSAKKGVHNNDLPARPWAQQAENESRLEIFEAEKLVKTTKDINNEEIVHTEVPFAAVILDSKYSGEQRRQSFLFLVKWLNLKGQEMPQQDCHAINCVARN